MKTFGRIVLLGWILVAIAVVFLFTFPRSAAGRIDDWIPTVVLGGLLIATAVYKLLRLYYAGMSRSDNTSPRRTTR
jgi:hypothetical protein